MKNAITFAIVMLLCIAASAQTQQGYVKTKGRMVNGKLVPGQGLKGATIAVRGRTTVLVNSDEGAFSFPAPDGQYHLDSVKKNGYQLIDMDLCPRSYKTSPNPLYIVMETPEQQLQDKLNAERKIRRNLQKQLQEKEDEIEALKEDNKISLEEYQKSMQKLYEEQESNEQLISDMAKRYSALDYDQLDEFYRQVSYFIESGELVKADSMLNTRGDLGRQVEEQLKKGQAIREQEAQLNMAKDVHAADQDELARRCYSYYETFAAQHLNDTAAYYLELRASLDTTNLLWQTEAGTFIDDYLADYDKVSSLNNIGYILSNLSDYANSIRYYEQALDIAINNFGETHRQTADVYNNFGCHYLDVTDYDKALKYIKKSSETYKSVLNPDDPIIASSYNNIGYAYSEMGNLDSALAYYNKALSMRERILGPEHPDVALSYNNIGFCYTHQRDIPTAMQYFKKALEIDLKVLGPKHPQCADMYNNIGFLYVASGDFEQGLEYYGKALEIRFNLFGEEHESTALSYDNIGYAYARKGDYDKALEYNSKALAIKQKLLGPEHPDVAFSICNIGFVYAKMEEYDTAMKYYNEAYEGEDHYNTKYTLQDIEKLKAKMKEQSHE